MNMIKSIDRKGTLSEQAYQIIREAIVINQLKPGDSLTEEQLALQLSISRTPLRLALKRLVYENIARINENNTVVVSNVTIRDVSDVSVVRCSLEPLAIREMNGKMTQEKLGHLKKIQEGLKAAHTHEEYLKYEYLFHVELARCAENDFLREMIERINLICGRFLLLSGTLDKYTELALKEHDMVLQYLEEGDFAKAEKAMWEHVDNVSRRMLVS